GYHADLLVLPDLDRFVPETVLKRGRPAAEIPEAEVPDWVRHTVRIGAFGPEMFRIPWDGGDARVIGIVPGQILTDSLVEAPAVRAGEALPDAERDLAKIAVVERHLGTGRVGLGFVRGFGLRRGAIASTVAHDAHNVVVVGMNDASMAAAVRRPANRRGGIRRGGEAPDGAEDLGGAVVTPGLVNTHHHLYQTLTRARAQQADLFTWLRTLYPTWARIDDEMEYAAARAGLAELALSGCTTVFDHH